MIAYNDNDLDVMARTIWGESRGEPKAGREAVAWVIRNRLNRPKRFAPTIAGVCQQAYQFSCWNRNDPNRPKMLTLTDEDPVFAECKKVASDVLTGDVPDPTHGSQFYCTAAVAAQTSWAKGHEPVVKIGHHWFYNDVS